MSPSQKTPNQAKRLEAAFEKAVLFLVVIGTVIYGRKVWNQTGYMDFDVYYRAAARTRAEQWDQVYSLADGASPFRYAPPFIGLFLPFALLSLKQARMLWFVFQVIWFTQGFALLRRMIQWTRPARIASTTALAAAILFTLRFYLDCLSIGQVSSLIFFTLCLSLATWMLRKPFASSLALSLPFAIKIGPAALWGVFTSSGKKSPILQAILGALTGLCAMALFSWVLFQEHTVELWQRWIQTVAADSTYFDAAHYGSQSLKSFILRSAQSGWLSASTVELLWLMISATVCLFTAVFWLSRGPRGLRGRALFFCVGLFPYIWCMPETFKYSLTVLAFPVAFLVSSHRLSRWDRFSIAFGACVLSFAGLDIVGSRLFFAIQKASLPFLATVFLGITTYRHAWLNSKRRNWSTLFLDENLPAFDTLPQIDPSPETTVSYLLAVPMEVEETVSPQSIRDLMLELQGAEWIAIPYGNLIHSQHPLSLAFKEQGIETFAATARTRNEALQKAFALSHGATVVALNLEQPPGIDFVRRAHQLLGTQKNQIIRANRRLPESRFRIPVKHLPIVYGRHRMGLAFNRWVRSLLGIHPSDTHSGSWVMPRSVALQVFSELKFSGFLFDLELSLFCQARKIVEIELPVSLNLLSEKSPRRIIGELARILWGVPLLRRRKKQGLYEAYPINRAITSDDWGLTPGVNQGILELAQLGIVRRVSAMARAPFLTHHLNELKEIPGVRIGLHFDLTYDRKDQTAGQLLLKSLIPGKVREQLLQQAELEFRSQLETLKKTQISVSYLDGHHHIHLLPGLLDRLKPLLDREGLSEVRLPLEAPLFFEKPTLWLLALSARRTMKRLQLNPLTCVYPSLKTLQDPPQLRKRIGLNPDAEVIVHPAAVNDLEVYQTPDPYRADRVLEFRALRMLRTSISRGQS